MIFLWPDLGTTHSGGWLADKYGRRTCLIASQLPAIIGAIFQGTCLAANRCAYLHAKHTNRCRCLVGTKSSMTPFWDQRCHYWFAWRANTSGNISSNSHDWPCALLPELHRIKDTVRVLCCAFVEIALVFFVLKIGVAWHPPLRPPCLRQHDKPKNEHTLTSAC